MKAYIYVIKDPDSKEIVYVGQTINPKARFYCHLNAYALCPIAQYIKHLKSINKKPIFEIVKTCYMKTRWSYEYKYMWEYKKAGCLLFNKTQVMNHLQAIKKYMPEGKYIQPGRKIKATRVI